MGSALLVLLAGSVSWSRFTYALISSAAILATAGVSDARLAPAHEPELDPLSPAAFTDLDLHLFRQRVASAIRTVERLLDSTRNPALASPELPHAYNDKFRLAEVTASVAVAAQLEVLEALGLNDEALKLADEWAASHLPATLRFRCVHSTTFLHEETREVEAGSKLVQRSGWGTQETAVVTSVTEYVWAYRVEHEVLVLGGADRSGRVATLQRRAGTATVRSGMKRSPMEPDAAEQIDVSLDWLLRQRSAAKLVDVRIDRSSPACLTPTRNAEMDAAVASALQLDAWARRVRAHLQRALVSHVDADGAGKTSGDVSRRISDTAGQVFSPVLPIFASAAASAASAASASAGGNQSGGTEASVSLQLWEAGRLVAEHRRSLEAAWGALDDGFPAAASGSLVSSAEAKLCAGAEHLRLLLQRFTHSVAYMEGMLRSQLAAAVGAQLTPADFHRFMAAHEAKLYRPSFAPQPWSLAVRRPRHSPEGVVAVTDASGRPILTHSRRFQGAAAVPMSFALDAATRVTFGGDRVLHAYLAHHFAGELPPSLRLTASARQFSCFMLLVGRLGPRLSFEPKHAVVLHNKDELTLPLTLSQLPTPKAFDEAVSSLSPSQRRFAQAYRQLQLEGSLFGVLVLQLKPQLEKLLRLDPDALTKEVALTQQVLDLFIQHQLPSDLISWDGDAAASASDKLLAVKGHVAALVGMVDAAKDADVREATRKRQFARGGAAETVASAQTAEAASLDDEGGPGPRVGVAMAPGEEEGGHHARRRRRHQLRSNMALRKFAAAEVEAAEVGGAGSAADVMDTMTQDAVEFLSARAAMTTPAEAMPGGGGTGHRPALKARATPTPTPTPAEAQRVTQSMPQTPADGVLPAAAEPAGFDFSAMPSALEAAYRSLDQSAAIRPTSIDLGGAWQLASQKSLLADRAHTTVWAEEQAEYTRRAFDLLDALSLSGELSFDAATLHVMVAATHHFDDSLVETVVAKNVNPIEKLERSSLIVASTLHGVEPQAMVHDDQRTRIAKYSAPTSAG